MTSSTGSLPRPWVVVTLVLTAVLAVSQGLSPHKRERVDRVVRQVMRCAHIPALSLAIVGAEDSSMYVKAYGRPDPNPDSRTKASIDTRFCLGEATQAFTAVLLAKLVSENSNVTWSTPIQDIVTNRVVLPDHFRSSKTNLVDILSHRTGMPSMDIVSVVNPFSSRRLVRNLRYAKPVAGFREKYVQSDVMFSLLEEVFQALGGDTWENLLKTHILRPLEMDSVLFLGGQDSFNAGNVAYPVVFFDGNSQALSLESLKGLGLVKPAAGLCLSGADMSKWIAFLLSGRGSNNQMLMEPEVLRETFRGVQPRGHSEDPEVVGYRQPGIQVSYSREQNALGWITGHYRGYQFISQDGSVPGYQALSTILPSRKVAVFVAFTGDGNRKSFAAKVLVNMFSIDTLLRGTTWFNESDPHVCHVMSQMANMEPRQEVTQTAVRIPKYIGARPLDDYVGYYRNFAYGDVFIRHNVTEDEDLLMEYGQAVYKVTPTNTNDTFQLIAKGLLWYSTNADTYSQRRLMAVFSEDQRDPERRVSRLSISGFDSSNGGRDVIFHTNPTEPHIDLGEDVVCKASVTSCLSGVVLVVVCVLGVLFR